MAFVPPFIVLSQPVCHTQTRCPQCGADLEYPLQLAPAAGAPLRIHCYSCQKVFDPCNQEDGPSRSNRRVPSPSASSGRTGHNPSLSQAQRRGRTIGTQEEPLETGYYDILGIPVNATPDAIKKAYRLAAIKHHPDKNRGDTKAEAKFKEVAHAYQILSNKDLRYKYNRYGAQASAPKDGFVDPEAVLSEMFGGERFKPLFGHISLARDMKSAMQEAEDAAEAVQAVSGNGEDLSPAAKKVEKKGQAESRALEKRVANEERVKKLVENLQRKLSIFTESATNPDDPDVTSSWRKICQLEAEELKHESYGVELLHAIGFVYVAKSKHHLATNQTLFGVGGWLHNVQGKYHVFSETVSTVRAALELKAVFDQIQAAEKAGNLAPEEKSKLEEQAVEMAFQAFFKCTKLDVESILRETCERVLSDPTISRDKALLRAIALQILGEAYMDVKKDPNPTGEDNEYVRIETKNSKA